MNTGIAMKSASKREYRTLEYLSRRRNDPERRREALLDALSIASFLKKNYSVRVFGIGSLFEEGRSFSHRSDIDLVVKGLPDNRFFTISAEAEKLTRFKLDIIPYESANSLVLETLRDRGVEL